MKGSLFLAFTGLLLVVVSYININHQLSMIGCMVGGLMLGFFGTEYLIKKHEKR